LVLRRETAMNAPDHLLVKDVYKQYGTKLVLDNVDLRISNGELVSVVGPSGCGKSTLLRLILGQEQPSSGCIQIDGSPIRSPDRSRGIVYQKYSLFPHLTVLGNVVLGQRLSMGFLEWRRERARVEAEAHAILSRMRLGKDLHKFPHELSGGMQQRVAIAQALLLRPRVLLMDEPFGALDPGTREDMQLYLLELWEELKMTVFFVTHDLEEAVFLGTRLLVLSQYYRDDRADAAPRGAKVVADHPLPKEANSTLVKVRVEFAEMLAQVRRDGFEPEYRKHVEEFNLRHPDSWRTLTPQEASDREPHSRT
jgi:NitT/TauT family transport system ATP-binding protein